MPTNHLFHEVLGFAEKQLCDNYQVDLLPFSVWNVTNSLSAAQGLITKQSMHHEPASQDNDQTSSNTSACTHSICPTLQRGALINLCQKASHLNYIRCLHFRRKCLLLIVWQTLRPSRQPLRLVHLETLWWSCQDLYRESIESIDFHCKQKDQRYELWTTSLAICVSVV